MAKYASASGAAPGWIVVSAGDRCPSCGAAAGCTVRDAGDYVHCRAVVSPLPMLGGGWLHPVLGGAARAGDVVQ